MVGDGMSHLHYNDNQGTILANHSNQSDLKICENPDRALLDSIDQKIPLFSQVAKEDGPSGNNDSPSKLIDRISMGTSIMQGQTDLSRDSAIVV
jgi:hypothetical protein